MTPDNELAALVVSLDALQELMLDGHAADKPGAVDDLRRLVDELDERYWELLTEPQELPLLDAALARRLAALIDKADALADDLGAEQ